jgi:hypothetical protein
MNIHKLDFNSFDMYIGNMICNCIVECNVKWYNKPEKQVYRLEVIHYDANKEYKIRFSYIADVGIDECSGAAGNRAGAFGRAQLYADC